MPVNSKTLLSFEERLDDLEESDHQKGMQLVALESTYKHINSNLSVLSDKTEKIYEKQLDQDAAIKELGYDLDKRKERSKKLNSLVWTLAGVLLGALSKEIIAFLMK